MTGERRQTRRRFLRTSGVVATVGLAGCSFEAGPVNFEVDGDGEDETPTPTDEPTSDETTDTPRGPRGGQLRLIDTPPKTLDPIAARSTAIVGNLFDGLTTFENGTTGASLQLAESVDISNDHRTYSFTLTDATFHDGRPVTAEDIVYSWERLAASEHSIRAFQLTDVLGVAHRTTTDSQGREIYRPGSLQVTAEDNRTLRMELQRPNHAVLEILAYPEFSVVPAGIVGDSEGYSGEMDYNEFATANPVGAGPFVLDAWRQGTDTEIVVSRHEDYHGRMALLDSIHWLVTTDNKVASRYGQNRNSDEITVPQSEWDPSLLRIDRTDDRGRRFGAYGPMANDRTVDYLGVPNLRTYYATFNTNKVAKPARQAFGYAMNQHEVASQAFQDRLAPAYHLTPPATYPGNSYYSHVDRYPYGYNQTMLTDAQGIMEDAGYSQDNPYEFTVTTRESSAWNQTLQLMQDKLAAAHINLKYEQMRFSTLFTRASRGDLDAYFLSDDTYNTTRPDELLERLNPPNTDTSADDSEGVYANWTGTAAAGEAKRAYQTIADNQEPTEAARRARQGAYVTMEEANWEDVVALPLVHGMNERFTYDWVDVPPFGAMGPARQALNTTSLSERSNHKTSRT